MTVLPVSNLLAGESSPYLRQHADNPVNWRPWSAASLAEAKELQRPILLSVGYAACHWCHVMAHESFEDDAVAAVMNRLFVNIKVDREERPDIDQIYMAALTAMGEQGGWPLTMFLTPEARPFWGGTYFPREARYGRPGFIQVLEAVARTWEERRSELDRSASALSDHVRARLAPPADGPLIGEGAFRDYAKAIHSSTDPAKGGLRGAPKFPNAPVMNVLRLSWLLDGEASHRDAVVHSLRNMLTGGIYDHLGGGLCRYSTDDSWLVPHFEKMLYDNAQLIDLAGWAYAETGDELFRVRIEETMGWLSREMLVADGGFASSLDADSEGEEGRFYLWTEAEIADVLGRADADRFLSVYQVTAPANWEGDPVLHRLAAPDFGPADDDPAIRSMKSRLFKARERRVRPARDDKVLVDWNGMTISALSRAGRQFGRDDWIDLAANAFRFVAESADGDRLPHSISPNRRLFPGLASDYAAMIGAAVSLCEATGGQIYVDRAWEWMAALDRWHADEAGTGCYLTASDAADVPMRIRGDVDEATPSATSLVLEAMTRLAMLTSDATLHERALAAADAACRRIASQRYGQAGILHAAEITRRPRKLIVVEGPDTGLVSVANRFLDRARTDIVYAGGRSDAGRITLPDGSTIDLSTPGAWLCMGQTCLPPVRAAAELNALLRRPG